MSESAEPYAEGDVPSLILLGDSITQYSFSAAGGWATIIADRLQRRCDVINRGYCGYNTRMLLHYLPSILNQFTKSPENVCGFVVFLGANDACDQSLNPQQHVPLLEYEDNLVEIVRCILEKFPHLKKDNEDICENIILISPPPVDEEMRQAYCNSQNTAVCRFCHVTECYAKACKEAAQRTNVAHCDFFNAAISAGVIPSMANLTEACAIVPEPMTDQFFTDGLHLGVNGANMLASILWPQISKITCNLKQFYPIWRDIDNTKLIPE